MSRAKPPSFWPAAPAIEPMAVNRLEPRTRAVSWSCSSERAPMPRAGKLTTRSSAPSSSGFSISRR